jgi:ParB family chromosome partitioning protein
MTFKESHTQFQMIDVTLIDPNPANPRQRIEESALKGLALSIRKMGLIHPLVVQPANAAGRHTLIVGERRWRAAVLAGEKMVPALIRPCEPTEALEIQVFENMGLGIRSSLEPCDMANAIQTISERFDTREAAAEHLGGTTAWLNQSTAAATANLPPKITALLKSGKISSAGTATQLKKLALRNEAKADLLISHVEHLPEGEKLTRKAVDRALSEEGGQRKGRKQAIPDAVSPDNAASPPPWETAAAQAPNRSWINPGKVKRVARILGLPDGNEEEVLTRLIDEFLALKGEENPPF